MQGLSLLGGGKQKHTHAYSNHVGPNNEGASSKKRLCQPGPKYKPRLVLGHSW